MYKQLGDFFSIAGWLEIGARCWSLQQETGRTVMNFFYKYKIMHMFAYVVH